MEYRRFRTVCDDGRYYRIRYDARINKDVVGSVLASGICYEEEEFVFGVQRTEERPEERTRQLKKKNTIRMTFLFMYSTDRERDCVHYVNAKLKERQRGSFARQNVAQS